MPLRAAPEIISLWIKPWEDSERDLHGESMVYVQIDNGQWMVEHAQWKARQPFAAVRQPLSEATPTPPPTPDRAAVSRPGVAQPGSPFPASDAAAASRNPARSGQPVPAATFFGNAPLPVPTRP
jgi:conjugal transfer pilus assembly protein TraV